MHFDAKIEAGVILSNHFEMYNGISNINEKWDGVPYRAHEESWHGGTFEGRLCCSLFLFFVLIISLIPSGVGQARLSVFGRNRRIRNYLLETFLFCKIGAHSEHCMFAIFYIYLQGMGCLLKGE